MKYDIVIVGAGPAGSTCAKFLAEKNIKVCLIDKNKFPRDKPCGGGIPTRTLDRFQYLKDKNIVESYSYSGFAYFLAGHTTITLQRDVPFIAMVIRKKFDMELVRLAINSGAKLIDGKKVKDIKISDNKVTTILGDGTKIESKIIVGADGVQSIVAKKLNLMAKRSTAVCVFHEYNISEKVMEQFFGRERTSHLHPNFQDISGYGWVFPKKQQLNIGVGSFDMSKVKTSLLDVYNDYIEVLKKSKIIPSDLKTGECKGGILPTSLLKKTYADKALIIGDAAGFVNPVSGEGIYYAMSSGEIAANVIINALNANNTSEKFLSKYQVAWKKDFGKDIALFLRLVKHRERQNDNFILLISKDKKLVNMVLDIYLGNLSIREYRGKLLLRYLYVFLKNRLWFTIVGEKPTSK